MLVVLARTYASGAKLVYQRLEFSDIKNNLSSGSGFLSFDNMFI